MRDGRRPASVRARHRAQLRDPVRIRHCIGRRDSIQIQRRIEFQGGIRRRDPLGGDEIARGREVARGHEVLHNHGFLRSETPVLLRSRVRSPAPARQGDRDRAGRKGASPREPKLPRPQHRVRGRRRIRTTQRLHTERRITEPRLARNRAERRTDPSVGRARESTGLPPRVDRTRRYHHRTEAGAQSPLRVERKRLDPSPLDGTDAHQKLRERVTRATGLGRRTDRPHDAVGSRATGPRGTASRGGRARIATRFGRRIPARMRKRERPTDLEQCSALWTFAGPAGGGDGRLPPRAPVLGLGKDAGELGAESAHEIAPADRRHDLVDASSDLGTQRLVCAGMVDRRRQRAEHFGREIGRKAQFIERAARIELVEERLRDDEIASQDRVPARPANPQRGTRCVGRPHGLRAAIAAREAVGFTAARNRGQTGRRELEDRLAKDRDRHGVPDDDDRRDRRARTAGPRRRWRIEPHARRPLDLGRANRLRNFAGASVPRRIGHTGGLERIARADRLERLGPKARDELPGGFRHRRHPRRRLDARRLRLRQRSVARRLRRIGARMMHHDPRGDLRRIARRFHASVLRRVLRRVLRCDLRCAL